MAVLLVSLGPLSWLLSWHGVPAAINILPPGFIALAINALDLVCRDISYVSQMLDFRVPFRCHRYRFW